MLISKTQEYILDRLLYNIKMLHRVTSQAELDHIIRALMVLGSKMEHTECPTEEEK